MVTQEDYVLSWVEEVEAWSTGLPKFGQEPDEEGWYFDMDIRIAEGFRMAHMAGEVD